MIKSTLVYIRKDNKYLMLYRNKKKNDPNAGKWVGIGGKFEEGETAKECMLREVFEEAGIRLEQYCFHGVIKFRSDAWEYEDMYLFTADFPGNARITECNEGDLAWIEKDRILDLPLWEGDRAFLKPLLNGEKEINMTLKYEGERLTEAIQENPDNQPIV